jgi:hypothetical protein
MGVFMLCKKQKNCSKIKFRVPDRTEHRLRVFPDKVLKSTHTLSSSYTKKVMFQSPFVRRVIPKVRQDIM